MSPELWKGPKDNLVKILDEPDKSGEYKTTEGEKLMVNMDLIHPSNSVNPVELSGPMLTGKKDGTKAAKGVRKVQLNRNGVGVQMLQGGEYLEVRLKNPNYLVKPKRAWVKRGRYMFSLH